MLTTKAAVAAILNMKLSVLIPTIEKRKEVFDILTEYLNTIKTDDVEILSMCDNKEMNIGEKRNKLLEQALGDYVCFIDDDDWVPDDYFTQILVGIEMGVDCIGFQVILNGMGSDPILCDLSNKWDTWANNMGGFIYVRCPNHLSPMKRELALAIKYPNTRYGEDADFSLRLKASGLIKTEHYIPKIMYDYRFKNEPDKY